jgi:hypothetical protein
MPLPFVSRTRLVLALAGIAPLAMLTACGSSDSTGPRSAPGVDTVAINAASYEQVEMYGYHGSDSSYYSWQNGDGYQDIGFYLNGTYFYEDRALMGFPLPSLAGRGVVDSAKAYVYQCGTSVMTLGSAILDHVHFGAALQDSAAFAGDVLQADVGTVSTDTSTTFHGVTVTSSVQGDYSAKRDESQFRMEFVPTTTLPPNSDNFVYFGEDECNGGSLPYLVIWSH